MKSKTPYSTRNYAEDSIYPKLKKIADTEGMTVAELLRTAVKWLIFIRAIKADPYARLLVEKDGKVQELFID